MDTKLVGPVADALADLSETDQQILSMTFVEELNSTEIGRRLGMTAVAVRVRRQRLLARLRDNEALRAVFRPVSDELDDIFEDAAKYTPDLVDM